MPTMIINALLRVPLAILGLSATAITSEVNINLLLFLYYHWYFYIIIYCFTELVSRNDENIHYLK